MEYTVHLGDDTIQAISDAIKDAGGEGGGESDFSTAEVTIKGVDSLTITGAISLICIIDEAITAELISPSTDTEETFTVPLYKNVLALAPIPGSPYSSDNIVSGAAEFANEYIIITGDCILQVGVK